MSLKVLKTLQELKSNNNTPVIRYGGLDLLKHVLALAVIFMHMPSESRYNAEVNTFILDIVHYIDGAVIGFFLISGFFFRPSTTILVWLQKTFKRMMLPFFIFSLAYAILMPLLGKGTFQNGLLSTITFQGAGMQLYFLSYLFIISFVYALLYIFSNKCNIRFNIILTILIIAGIIVSLIFPTESATGSHLKLIPIYVLSFGIGVWFSKSMKISLRILCYSVLLAVVIGSVIGIFDHRYLKLAAMALLVLCAVLISIRFKSLQRTYSGSGGVYLLHTPIVNFTISTLLLLISVNSYLNLFVSWVMTYVFCLLFIILFIKFFPSKRWVLLE